VRTPCFILLLFYFYFSFIAVVRAALSSFISFLSTHRAQRPLGKIAPSPKVAWQKRPPTAVKHVLTDFVMCQRSRSLRKVLYQQQKRYITAMDRFSDFNRGMGVV